MKETAEKYVGIGIYSIPEAANLTGVNAARIRRWLESSGAVRGRPSALWQTQLPRLEHHSALGFQDLIELRFVDAFVRAGVSWRTLRDAHARASKLVGSTHPFSTNVFRTEGRHIFVDLVELRATPGLVEVCKSQHYFESFLRPILKDLEFAQGEVRRWWPLGSRHQVVLDPARSFGQPIVTREGVPTAVLARAFASNGSETEVCKWFEVSPASLRDALAFEQRSAA